MKATDGRGVFSMGCGDGLGVEGTGVASVGSGVDASSVGNGVGAGVGRSVGCWRRSRSDVMSGRSRKPPKPSSE